MARPRAGGQCRLAQWIAQCRVGGTGHLGAWAEGVAPGRPAAGAAMQSAQIHPGDPAQAC